jgi:hypothetical protein
MALGSPLQLGTSETTIKAAGASEKVAVLTIMFCNMDTVTRTVTAYAYATGGSAGASTTFLSAISIPSGNTYIWTGNEKFILENSDKISALADVANKVTVITSYMVL